MTEVPAAQMSSDGTYRSSVAPKARRIECMWPSSNGRTEAWYARCSHEKHGCAEAHASQKGTSHEDESHSDDERSSAGGSVRDDPGPACTNTWTDDIDNDHHAVRACRSIGARRGAWIGPGVDDATGVERDTGIVDDSATAIGVPGNKSQPGLDQ